MLKSFFSILLWITGFASALIGQYSFVNYDYTNGLPLDEVMEVAEDSLGYIWLGGPLGLSRFDGRNFTHYYRDSPAGSIAGNIVNDISVTPSGEVVAVFDDNGLSVYNHKSDSFRSRNYRDSDSLDFPRHSIYFVHVVNDTSAYIGANREGMYHINLKTFESRKIPIRYIPYDMVEDPERKGDYILSGRGGLKRLNMTDFSIEDLTKSGYSRLKIIDGDVWRNSYAWQVQRYNLKTGVDRTYRFYDKNVVRGWTLVDGDLWGASPEGLEIVDTLTGELKTIIKAGVSSKDLQGTFIYDLFKDSKNRVWVSTDGGLSLYDPSKSYLERTEYIPFQSSDLIKMTNGDLLSMDFYKEKIVRIGENRKVTEIKIEDGLTDPVEVISRDDELLIVFYNGIGKLNLQKAKITSFATPFTKSKNRGLIQVLIKDQNWSTIYRHQHEFINWNSLTNEMDTLPLGGKPRGMINTNDGNIWIYGIDFLWMYNLKSKSSTNVSVKSGELALLAGDINKIDEDPEQDEYWICTRMNGVFKASYQDEKFKIIKHYSEADGLTNNNVIRTHIDDSNTFFVQCRSGVFVHDSASDRFIAIGGKNELNVQTTYGLSVIDSILHVLGYESKSIDLRKVQTSPRDIVTLVKEIRVNGNKWSDFGTYEVDLPYDENNIGISFSTLEFTDPSSIRHRYRLQTEDEWVYTEPNSGLIQLSALAVGDYHFQLSASNGNGLWADPVELNFSINPPYWRTWWFVLLGLVLLTLLGYILYSLRMRQLDKINAMNVKLAELEGESLRAQMNPHFVFNALNSIKSYIIKNSKEEAADYLTTFSELIRAVLRNSTQKEISLQDEIDALILYLQIENLRLNQPFKYQINISEEINPRSVAFPPLIIQPFVENSIWHGFVHKKTGGNLTINIQKKVDKLSIDVIDDGVGRKKSKEIEKSRERKRSYGIAITETRLNNITEKADIQIFDLHHEDGSSGGTRVQIVLPYQILEPKTH